MCRLKLADLSIAMGTFNGASFLSEQLESLRRQTILPGELMICDDRSVDGTVQIIENFAKTAPFPVKVTVNDQRLGFAENFLKAAAQCSLKYIAFCDQDDIWYCNKIRHCVELLDTTGSDLCAHDAHLCDSTGKIFGHHSAGLREGVYQHLQLDPWGVFFGFSCVFNRSLLAMLPSTCRPEDDRDAETKLSHDRWVYFLSNSLGSTVYTKLPLAAYRQHHQNLFSTKGKVTSGQKIKKLLFQSQNYIRKYMRISSQRVCSLEQFNYTEYPDRGEAAMRALEFWRNMAETYQKRLPLHLEEGFVARIKILRTLMSDGTYMSIQDGGCGRRAFLEDLVKVLYYHNESHESPRPSR